MNKQDKDLLIKQLEAFVMYLRHIWKEYGASGGELSKNRFYEFAKDKVSKDLTRLTNSDLRQQSD